MLVRTVATRNETIEYEHTVLTETCHCRSTQDATKKACLRLQLRRREALAGVFGVFEPDFTQHPLILKV
jgi:hypothetical protein